MILYCLISQTYGSSIFFMRTVPVSVFLPHACSKEKKVMSYKIQKLSLLFSYRFWTQILFINSRRSLVKRGCLLVHILCPIQFIVNFVLVLCSILCPVVFTVYVFFVKYNIIGNKMVISVVKNGNYFI